MNRRHDAKCRAEVHGARPRALSRLAILLLVVAGCAASNGGADDSAEGADDALIHGSPATTDRFPSTVYLKSGCTAAKVGEKLILTAAHCVLNTSSNSPKWKEGDTLGISRAPANGYTDVTIAAVHVHPDWQKACDEQYCASSEVTAKLDAPDAAIIEVKDAITDIPNAKVDTTALANAAPVVEIGFGCTEGVSVADKRMSPTMLFAATKILSDWRATAAKAPSGCSSDAITGGCSGWRARSCATTPRRRTSCRKPMRGRLLISQPSAAPRGSRPGSPGSPSTRRSDGCAGGGRLPKSANWKLRADFARRE